MKAIFQNLMCVPAFLLAVAGPAATAQPPDVVLAETPVLNGPYRLDIRVLVGGNAAARVKDRDWSQLFQEAGFQVTIESDNGSRKLGIHSREAGRRSVVEVVGLVDRQGALRLGKSQFRLGNVQPLKLFLDDLVKNGAGGPIRMRPTWGLSISQYEEVLKLMAVKMTGEVDLSVPMETVKTLQLSPEFHVTWSDDSRKTALLEWKDSGSIDLHRLSTGTGLAIAMAQFGLGFRVMEHPRTGYVLEIDVGNESSNLWPIGWKNKQALTNVLPKLYERVAVDLPDEKVDEVIGAIADRIDVPYFFSQRRLLDNGIDFRQIRYSAPFERRSPSGLLRSLGARHRMEIEARTDEAGQLFLWCTTEDDQKAWNKRFAQVIPGKNE